jgi:hypothetical protein
VNLIADFLSFISTPLGQALVKAVPTLISDVIGIWHKSGTITSDDIVNYVASQKSFEALVPKRTQP